MSTKIEWTQRPGTKGETWNPTTGCNKVSQGCKNCYAEVMHRRLHAMGAKGYERPFLSGARPLFSRLSAPLKWKAPRTVFVNSMSDLFHETVPFAFIDQVFAVMAMTPQHTYQVLTKRPERMAEYFRGGVRRNIPVYDAAVALINADFSKMPEGMADSRSSGGLWWPLKNVWLGTSVEDQRAADERIPHLLKCPAAVRFLSCEPLLGPVSLTDIKGGGGSLYQVLWPINAGTDADRPRIDWVIAGGESGPGARPMHPDWARSLRDQCQAAGVPFFFKQWGEWLPVSAIEAAEKFSSERTMLFSKVTGKPYMGVKSLTDTGQHMARVGKHASGNLLDGRTHLEYPRP